MKVYIVNEIVAQDYDCYGTESIGAFSSMEKACDAINAHIDATYNVRPKVDWMLKENPGEYMGYVWMCDDDFIITKYEIWQVEFDGALWLS